MSSYESVCQVSGPYHWWSWSSCGHSKGQSHIHDVKGWSHERHSVYTLCTKDKILRGCIRNALGIRNGILRPALHTQLLLHRQASLCSGYWTEEKRKGKSKNEFRSIQETETKWLLLFFSKRETVELCGLCPSCLLSPTNPVSQSLLGWSWCSIIRESSC